MCEEPQEVVLDDMDETVDQGAEAEEQEHRVPPVFLLSGMAQQV